MPSAPRLTLLLAAAAVFVGCSGIPVQQRFRHVDDRQAQVFTKEDLLRMKFYVERNVLVLDVERTDLPMSADGPLLVRQMDPGKVLDVGPNWLRGAFGEGTGVFFMTNGNADDQYYYLATEGAASGQVLAMVKELDDPRVSYQGKTYPIAQGADTLLHVDVADMRAVLAERVLPEDR